MEKHYDIIIIGAGVIGLFIAYFLSKKNVNVLVIEKNIEVGMGISKGQAGVIHVIQLPFNSLKSQLAIEGNKLYDIISKELKVRFRRVNAMLLSSSLLNLLIVPFIYLYLKRKLGGFAKLSLILLNRNLKKICSDISDSIKAGILITNYGVIDVFDLIYKLYLYTKVNHIDYLFQEEVVNIHVRENVIVVETHNGLKFTCKYLVNAAGLGAKMLAKKVGDNYDIVYGKGTMIVYKYAPINIILAPLSIRGDPKTKGGAVIPTVIDNKIILGPNLSVIEDPNDISVNLDDVNSIKKKFFPLLKTSPQKILKYYSGIRPIASTNDFIIEYSRSTKNIIHLIGITSPGLTAAPAIAKMVINMLKLSGLKLTDKVDYKNSDVNYMKEVAISGSETDAENKDNVILCPCHMITKNDVKAAVKNGVKTFQGLMFRTKIGFDYCFFTSHSWNIIKILSDELGITPDKLTYKGRESWMIRKC